MATTGNGAFGTIEVRRFMSENLYKFIEDVLQKYFLK
jgi:hypothetical protein